MCKFFSVFCCCCSRLIKNFYFLQCSKTICNRKFVYPRQDQKCDDCLAKCRGPSPCTRGIGLLPRYWIEKSEERIVQFQAIQGFLVATTSSQQKFKLQKIRFFLNLKWANSDIEETKGTTIENKFPGHRCLEGPELK